MPPIDESTPNRSYPLPHENNTLVHDVERLRQAYAALDTDVQNVLVSLGLKAPVNHGHTIAQVDGLQGALDGKMSIGTTFALNDISDVDVGTSENFQVLTKSGTGWIPSFVNWGNLASKPTTLSGFNITDAAPLVHNHDDRYFTETEIGVALAGKAAAAHSHAISDVTGLQAALNTIVVPRGHIDGLILANNATDAANDIDIKPGQAVSDDGYVMNVAAALTKRLDAAWTVGNNQGGLDTGTKANATWYHMWLIARTDTGVVDVLFSAHATAPTMPASYTKKRRIGSVYNDTGSIKAFTQVGEEFLWTAPSIDVDVANPVGTSANLRTLLTPLGIKTRALLSVGSRAGAGYTISNITSPDTADQAVTAQNAASVTAATAASTGSGGTGGVWGWSDTIIRTNTTSQIRHRTETNDGRTGIITRGWLDPRGRDA